MDGGHVEVRLLLSSISQWCPSEQRPTRNHNKPQLKFETQNRGRLALVKRYDRRQTPPPPSIKEFKMITERKLPRRESELSFQSESEWVSTPQRRCRNFNSSYWGSICVLLFLFTTSLWIREREITQYTNTKFFVFWDVFSIIQLLLITANKILMLWEIKLINLCLPIGICYQQLPFTTIITSVFYLCLSCFSKYS